MVKLLEPKERELDKRIHDDRKMPPYFKQVQIIASINRNRNLIKLLKYF